MSRKARKRQSIQATLLQFPERSDRQLARELGCSHVYISRLRKELGIAPYETRRDFTGLEHFVAPTKRQAIQCAISAHPEWNDSQVASAVGCHYSYVSLVRRAKR